MRVAEKLDWKGLSGFHKISVMFPILSQMNPAKVKFTSEQTTKTHRGVEV
jgi:hypothetical protein